MLNLLGRFTLRKKTCSGELCAHKKNSKSLGRSENPCPQCTSRYQVPNILFKEQINSFLLMCNHGIFNFAETQKSVQDIIGDEMSIVLAGIVQDKSVPMSRHRKRLVTADTNLCHAKRATLGIIFLRTRNRQLCCLAVIGHIALSKRRIMTTKMQNGLF